MNKTDDPFDGKLGLDLSDPAFAHLSDPTIAPKTGGQPKRKASEWKRYYTLFPYSWQERLRGCKAGSIFLLALCTCFMSIGAVAGIVSGYRTASWPQRVLAAMRSWTDFVSWNGGA